MSDQVEPTRVLAVGDPADEATVNIAQAQIDADRQAAEEEAQRQAEEARARQAERAARERALGAVPVSSADEDVTPQPIPEPDNDRFFPSLGLTLLRLVLAGFLGVRGVQIIFDINGTTTWLDDRYVPFPDIVAWLLGVF
ncbi:MAG: hypothetical protein FWD80_06300, partial [Propionibacteriaceae bacterium]|nr:hypothetical protein [Propionibacteriaceae bacterium]